MIRQILQEAFILKSKGYYKHAIKSFYKALEHDNNSSELMLEIADCYYKLGDEERALSYIEQNLDKNPTHIESLRLLQSIFLKKNAIKEAEQTAKNIYYISSRTSDLVEILRLLNKQNRFNEIFEYKTDSPTSEILYEQAFANLFLNNLEEAEKLINNALEMDCSTKALLLKSKILFKMNRKEESLSLFETIEPDRNSDDFINFAGLLYQYKQDFKKAIEYFKEAIKISPSNDQYYYNCASTYFKQGELQQAKKYYNLAISLNPENQNYHFALANLYYSEKHYKRALEELDYDFFEAKLLKSIILYDSGYLAIAKKELDSLLQERPDNQIVLDYKSRIEDELKA